MNHEKKKLAETLGVSEAKLEKMIASYAKKNKGGKTHPLSRAVSSKYTGLPIPRRLLDTRAMAGRAAKGGKGMTKRERQILEELGAEGTKMTRNRRLALLGGLAGGAGVGKAVSD